MWISQKHFFILLITLFILGTTSAPQNCKNQNPPIQCLLFRYYPQITQQLSCQLCAVALQSGKYKQKTDYFCTQEGKVRDCELTSFAYLLLQGRILQALDLEYESFYTDPFKNNQKVQNLLRKQNIRSSLINWLQKNMNNQQPDYLLSKSIANYYLDDNIQSLKQIEAYTNKYEQNQITVKIKSRIYQKSGQFNQALNFISSYIKQKQDQGAQIHPYLYHLKGNFLMHHLKFDKAVIQFQKANKLFQNIKDFRFKYGFKFSTYNIGLCYQKMGNYQQSTRSFISMVAANQKYAEILNALGTTYLQWAQKQQKLDNSKMNKGIFYLRKAIQADQQYYIAHFNLATAYLRLNETEKAIQTFKKSLQIKVTSQAQYGLLSAYFRNKMLNQAENFIHQSIKVDSQNIDEILSIFYNQLCLNLDQSNKNSVDHTSQVKRFYDKTLKAYQDLIKSADGYYWLGMIYFNRQNYGLSIDYFLQAYQKGYKEPYLLFNLAYCYQLVEDYPSAIQYYNKAYKKDARKQTKQNILYCQQRLNARNAQVNKGNDKTQQKSNNQEL